MAWFDDTIGSFWKIDLSAVYPNAIQVSRSVVHLFPGIVAVLDRAVLKDNNDIVLRWHTISDPELGKDGSFSLYSDSVCVTAHVESLNNQELEISKDRQSYQPPYHLTRQGDPLVQDYEPYVEIHTASDQCAILSLFAISKQVGNNSSLPAWQAINEGWQITVQDHTYLVQIKQGQLITVDVSNPEHKIVAPDLN